MTPFRLLDLFSGIGGFSLGLERSGAFKTVAFCEIEPFPRAVLAKHWPGVPCYEDVRTISARLLSEDGIEIDAICGGFPCQDISTAGKGAGITGERSGLWFEFARLIGEIRPKIVIVENVSALLGRGFSTVLGDLAALGYDAEWHCIPASYIGAPHRRDRIWIISYPKSERCEEGRELRHKQSKERTSCGGETMAYTDAINAQGLVPGVSDTSKRTEPFFGSFGPCDNGEGWWSVEPKLGRVADGVPNRAHRLCGLGNAVVPQIPEIIGRAILTALEGTRGEASGQSANLEYDGADRGGVVAPHPILT